MPSPADTAATQRIFQERARALAREKAAAAPAGDLLEVLEFVLAYERYGLETAFVREVQPLQDLTPLPGTPRFILGIINVRGQILAVNDLKKFFQLPEKGLSDLNKVIILRRGSMEMGVMADAVTGVRRLPLAELQAPPPTLEGIGPDYLKGITRDALVVLDAAKILSDPKLIVHEEVAPPAK